jgi:hypothetical protein
MKIEKPDMPKSFVKDNDGHIVLWQWPNIPLYGWIIFKALSLIVSKGHLKTGIDQLSMAFLFTWALLEVMQGVNYFRRLLGLAVLIAIATSYFK